MAKKPTRLHFTEEELANPQIQKVAERAEKAADKAEKSDGNRCFRLPESEAPL